MGQNYLFPAIWDKKTHLFICFIKRKAYLCNRNPSSTTIHILALMRYLLPLILVFACASCFFACSDDKTETPRFADAFLYSLHEGDTVNLGDAPDSTTTLRLYYGRGVLDIYRAYITWTSSDTEIVRTRKGLSTVKGDSCYSLCTLMPNGKPGMAEITVTMLFGGTQRQMRFMVTTGFDRMFLGLPDGSFREKVNGEEFTMVFVRADTLYQTGGEMGRQLIADSGMDNKWVKDYNIHTRYLEDYYIGQTEVTTELWKAVMGKDNPYQKLGWTKRPVNNLAYNEIQEFLERLNGMTGRQYRLPWEAEWEFAARGGRMRKGYLYAGSDNLDEVAWYEDNSRYKNSGRLGGDGQGYGLRPHRVAQLLPNELKLYDMMGNVSEWCEDSLLARTSIQTVRFAGRYRIIYKARRTRGGNFDSHREKPSVHTYAWIWDWLEGNIGMTSNEYEVQFVSLNDSSSVDTINALKEVLTEDAKELFPQLLSFRYYFNGFRLALPKETQQEGQRE